MWRAGAIVLLCAGVGQAAPATPAAQSGAGPAFVKGPFLQRPAPTGVRILFELAAAAPATVTVDRPGQAPLRITAEAALRHDVLVSGLEPSHRYRYQVTVGSRSEVGELATAPAPFADEPFSFVVYGDTRDDNGVHRAIVDRMRGEAPDLLLCAGDMVNPRNGWQAFFDAEAPLMRDVPLYPTIGNHDDEGRGARAAFAEEFSLPDTSPGGEAYYSFDYGASRFVVLDSNGADKTGADQTEWLDRTLRATRAEPRIKHVFALMHHPPFSVATHGGDPTEQKRWVPLFEQYHVDVVFSGHDHVYERMSDAGVLYMVSGGAGASLYPRSMMPKAADKSAARFFERVHHYVRVQVDGGRIELSGIRDDGSLIETLHLGVASRPARPAALVLAALPTPAAKPLAAPARASGAAAGGGGFGCQVGAGPGPGSRFGGGWLLLGLLGLVGLSALVRSRVRA